MGDTEQVVKQDSNKENKMEQQTTETSHFNTWTPERIQKFDEILSRGLCIGIGNPGHQMCIEAAISVALDMPFSDEPDCVTDEIRIFKINLNDSYKWASTQSRAKHLRSLGIAQIGSKGVIDGKEFLELLSKKIISTLIPQLFREVFPGKYEEEIKRCEEEPTQENCLAPGCAWL